MEILLCVVGVTPSTLRFINCTFQTETGMSYRVQRTELNYVADITSRVLLSVVSVASS